MQDDSQLELSAFITVVSATLLSLQCYAQVSPVAAGQQAQRTDEAIFWQSTNSTQAELAVQVGQLYTTLDLLSKNGIEFPTERVLAGKKTVEEILRERRQMFGSHFPHSVNVFTCRLNMGSCALRGGKVNWNYQPDDYVIVPAFNFQPFPLNRVYKKAADERLDQLVVSSSKGCEKYDKECRQVIVNLNDGNTEVLKPSYAGRVEIPVLGYSVEIPITRPRNDMGGQLCDAAGSPWLVCPLSEGAEGVSSKPLHRFPVPSPQEVIIDDRYLGDRLEQYKAKALKSQAQDIEGRSATRSRVLAAISHPGGQPAPGSEDSDVTIGVIDNWVFPKHCLYSDRITYLNESEPDESTLPGDTGCGALLATVDLVRDHGTHVVGIISSISKQAGTTAGPGVNPLAYVTTIQVDVSYLGDPRYASKASKRLSELRRSKGSPKVFNMSIGYPAIYLPTEDKLADPLQGFIELGASTRLFVAAVDDQPYDISRQRACPTRPSCLNAPNVLTVTAATVSNPNECPHLLDGSAYGEGVDIAAPGERIVSTTTNHTIGVMTGTSQAAPIVTAVASMLFAKRDTLHPITVKNRLIYTSDICSNLKVYGGLVNVNRALAFQTSQLTLKGSGEVLYGSILERGRLVKPLDLDCSPNRATCIVPIVLKSVRRLVKMAEGEYRVYFHEGGPEMKENSSLKRANVKLDASTLAAHPGELTFSFADQTRSPRTRPFRLQDVVDYVAPIEEY